MAEASGGRLWATGRTTTRGPWERRRTAASSGQGRARWGRREKQRGRERGKKGLGLEIKKRSGVSCRIASFPSHIYNREGIAATEIGIGGKRATVWV
ncbi:hypothetical protein BHE74_00041830 [Ensete ventricosum]|nr:hypothetical protein GW17_00008387 [Ensete ventricosum]RWW51791.1 hypothetical protein BHE74_00041830 [Ensete ventricosum]RZS17084.1 hypothetical protein BHM03_00049194 [Ensete ventricosum]